MQKNSYEVFQIINNIIMKKISLLIISAIILMYNCEKSETNPDNPDPDELNHLYDTVELNNLYIMFNC